MENEKAVYVHGPDNGIFRTTCEVLETSDPDNKILRFAEGCCWGSEHSPYGKPRPNQLRSISVLTYWHDESDVGEVEARYRVSAVLNAPPGYRAVLEVTTKPEEIAPSAAAQGDAARCESAILTALESEPRMSLRDLKRKTNANRFSRWDGCLQKLAADGELTVTADSNRTWVELSSS